MSSLPQTFSSLLTHHIATPARPLPPDTPGIAWIWAANGVFKRGSSKDLTILIPVYPILELIPGLVALMPSVAWRAWPRRIAGQLLAPLLDDAQRAGQPERYHIWRGVEKQYFFVVRNGTLKLIAPQNQEGSFSQVQYSMPAGDQVLIDVHSHHVMPAFFSATDDHDDAGLSVSVVIGEIFAQPLLRCRLNVYGHHYEVPATFIFDDLGPFYDGYQGGQHATAHD